MRCLPPVHLSDGEAEYRVVLFCPRVDLIRLMAGKADSENLNRSTQLLAFNPALLIYGSIQFHQSHQRAASSLIELTSWLLNQRDDFFRQILKRPTCVGDSVKDSASFSRIELGKYLRRFLKARKSKNICKSLTRWLIFSTELPKPIARKTVEICLKPVVDSFSKNVIDSRSRPSRRERDFVFRNWIDESMDETELASFLHLWLQGLETEKDFSEKLSREKMAALKQLAYGASHEINNPLANIATRAQTLLHGESNQERRHKLAVIYEQAIRSHEMISDLMLFANPPQLNLEQIELASWLAGLNSQAKALIESLNHESISVAGTVNQNGASVEFSDEYAPLPRKPIHFAVRVSSGLREFQGDATHLAVALHALLRNSVESLLASSGSHVELRIGCEEGFINFSVIDDGNGVPESIAGHLFDPFYSGREAGRGLGFGLPKAWRIAQLHGGKLVLDGSYQMGAKFDLRIPLASSQYRL